MKLLQLSKILIFSVLLGAVFTSCEGYDTEYRRAQLNIEPAEYYTNSYGEFGDSYTIYIEDLQGVNVYREDIYGMRLLESQLFIESQELSPRYDRIYLRMQANNGEWMEVNLPVVQNNPSLMPYAYADLDDPDYAYFMDALFYRLLREGRVTLHMDGKVSTPVRGMPILFTLKNLVELELR